MASSLRFVLGHCWASGSTASATRTWRSSSSGPFAQNLALPFATRVGRRPLRRVVLPRPIETPEILEHLRSRLGSGAFRPIIDRTYPLEDIVEAHRYVEIGQKVGNVVITVRTD